jgi:hypothetical protein
MRLTNLMRESFVRAVMLDVPYVRYEEEITKAIKQAARDAMPEAIKAIADKEELSSWLNEGYLYAENFSSVRVPKPYETSNDLKTYCPDAYEAIDVLIKKRKAQSDERQTLEKKLQACALACSTRKQLLDMLPEFEKYLPDDEKKAAKSYPLVANVVSDFVKAGWPKNKELANAR